MSPKRNSQYPKRKSLVTFVTDIRDFSKAVENNTIEVIYNFIQEFFGVVERITVEVTENTHPDINCYLGDGFLIFLDDELMKNAIEKAVKIGIQLREEFRYLCKAPSFVSKSLIPDLGIGTGITCGDVVYGLIGTPGYGRRTGIGSFVNKAFRLASRAEKDEILVDALVWPRIKHRFNGNYRVLEDVRGFGDISVYAVEGEK